ncbi:hypothetical protein [Halobaculum roseum]|uniref:Uncharacterized protein n=1 Tax=Halobaculum roseum TaxID=2175149 RepID=A0ABD5MQC5_9EURY|nr:hypothetical protein [Halobaculum roseum]QZY04550.1 hypothetical protein K6T36_16455 [Halobaculum roseum]
MNTGTLKQFEIDNGRLYFLRVGDDSTNPANVRIIRPTIDSVLEGSEVPVWARLCKQATAPKGEKLLLMTDRRFVILDTEREGTDEIPLSQVRLLSVESPRTESRRAAANALGRASIFTRLPTAVLQAKEQLRKELSITTTYAKEYRFTRFDGVDADKVCRELQLNLRTLLDARNDSEVRGEVLERIEDNIAKIPEADIHLPAEFLESALESDSPVDHVLAYRDGVRSARESKPFTSVTFRRYDPETQKSWERGWEEEASKLPAAEEVTVIADLFGDETEKLESELVRAVVRPGDELVYPLNIRDIGIVIGDCTPDPAEGRILITPETKITYENDFRDPDPPELPYSLTEQEPREIYMEGVWQASEGSHVSDCPYRNLQRRNYWKDGYEPQARLLGMDVPHVSPPPDLPDPQAREWYREGAAAAYNDRPESIAPGESGSEQYRIWMRGFEDEQTALQQHRRAGSATDADQQTLTAVSDPMERAVYEKGMIAAYAGESLDDCPFETRAWQDIWEQGFTAATEEEE